MRSRSPADAPAMLFQLAGSPVQRRGPRYTSAPHEATIITLPPRLLAPRLWENGATFFRSEPPSMRRLGLMFCIKQIVNASPSPPVKAISQKRPAGVFMASIITRLVKPYSTLESTSAANLTSPIASICLQITQL